MSEAGAPLTLWQIAPFMVCDLGVYVLTDLLMRDAGLQDSFTTAQLAGTAGISLDRAQRWIDKALTWNAVQEVRSAKMKGKESNLPIPCKNAERQLRGAAVAKHYRLTPGAAQDMIRRRLSDYAQELLERGEPDVIRREEGESAGLDSATAEALELTTKAISQTVEAFEVSAQAEREGDRKAQKLLRLAELDTTPFSPDAVPCTAVELRALLIGALIATKPAGTVWQHSELMWIAGVKKGSVSRLVRKSAYIPAEFPTFINAPIEGADLRLAVRAACAKHHGAPVAWLDADGEVIGSFSHNIPLGAKAVRLNIGKQYLRRAEKPAGEVVPDEVKDKAEELPVVISEPPDPAEVAKTRARRGMLTRLRGCMTARGWHYIGGAYSFWERGKQAADNTFEGMMARFSWITHGRRRSR